MPTNTRAALLEKASMPILTHYKNRPFQLEVIINTVTLPSKKIILTLHRMVEIKTPS